MTSRRMESLLEGVARSLPHAALSRDSSGSGPRPREVASHPFAQEPERVPMPQGGTVQRRRASLVRA